MTGRDRHLLLWGPTGVGKTTVGAALATRLSRRFVDLDRVIEDEAGRSVPAIFAAEGEPGFRERERSALRALLKRDEESVIALGGGTLVDRALRDEALRGAVVVTLLAAPRVIEARLSASPMGRPLVDSATPEERSARLGALLRSRAAAYAVGHLAIATDALEPVAIAETIAVRLGGFVPLTISAANAYGVHLAPGAAAGSVAESVAAQYPTTSFLVTDATVAALHLDPVVAAMSRAGHAPHVIVLPGGEPGKNIDSALSIVRELASHDADRKSVLVALGGGVVTDTAGFAASMFSRGIRWVAVPTTIIGMVDAAIGGKTGVNLEHAKNAIGAFHHPRAVIVDASLSRTESPRAIRSGLAEAVKSAAIIDSSFFEWFEENVSGLAASDPALLENAVRRSVEIKTDVVERDPDEQDLRAILNFGHTVGHALETAGRYETFTHGEAVSIGMVAAAKVGRALGVTPDDVCERLARVLEALGLPTEAPASLREAAVSHLMADKKREGSKIRFVVLERMGRATTRHVTEAQVGDVLLGG